MNIRSLTVGAALPEDEVGRASLIQRLGAFAQAGRGALEDAGFTVQTTRLSTQPLEQIVTPGSNGIHAARHIGQTCLEFGLDYCSLGTVQAAGGQEDLLPLIASIPDLLFASENLFASVQVGERQAQGGTVNLDAALAAAGVIAELSARTSDGFGNLRFAAAANCPPHVPFFPASYYNEDSSNSGDPEFGLALEAADLAVLAFEGARTPDEARQNLLGLLVEQGTRAVEACGAVGSLHGITFTGLDISMAPYPDDARSIARAMEKISGAPTGAGGTLTAAAFITSILKEARALLPTTGYSGLMLPVLEDQNLADRAAEGLVTIDTLLLLSAVCGLGLDTLPLPGDVSRRQLQMIIVDMATLAVRLDKPLTARLLPVPGKVAGDPAEWPHFPFFARGLVMPVPGGGSSEGQGLLNSGLLHLS